MLSLTSEPGTDCSDIRQRVLDKRDDVDLEIKCFRQKRAILTKLVDACPGKSTMEFCTILGAIEPPEHRF